MKLEVDFPITGLPDDRELVGVEYRRLNQGEYGWAGGAWGHTFPPALLDVPRLVAILKPKEVWLPCTPEDAFAKMLHPESRVIRTAAFKTLVEKVRDLDDRSMGFKLVGHPICDARCPYYQFEVLKTKELS